MYITVDDFTNKFTLAKGDFNETKIEEYIDRYETITLVELFGKELFDLWETGIALPTPDPIYVKLRDSFIEQLDGGIILNSRGIKDVLLGAVYFHYKTDGYTQETINGSVKNKGENSESVTLLKANVQSRYNEAISSYCAIQHYILENSDVYPTFKGAEKSIMSVF